MSDSDDTHMTDVHHGPTGTNIPATHDSANSTTAPSDSPLLTIDEFMRNEVEIASANHGEVKTRPLSSLEEFYLKVHEVYQHQTLQAHTKEQQEAAKTAAASPSSSLGSSVVAPIAWPFGGMETKIFQARYQIDNIVHICDQLLRSNLSHQRNLSTSAAGQPQQPMLALVEKNTEMQETKQREQLQLQKDEQRAERERAAAQAMTDEARAAIEAAQTKDQEEAEFNQDEEGDEEVLVIPDPADVITSLETRRKRLGTLLMHKRRQYSAATDVLTRGREQLGKSIEGERKFLHGLSHLAKYWTIRTIQNDVSAATSISPATHTKGPLFNPFQNGLPAGSMHAYPSLMIDYRIGALDISLDRGKAWLYRNDAGDIFLDDAIGKEESIKSSTHESNNKHASTTVKSEDTEMKSDQPSTTSASVPPPIPSWLNVSNRLHRAQHQLLYKHLYNALMTEAREWRIQIKKEQQIKSSSTTASSTTTPTTVTPFQPPPSIHTSRPWSITEITPRLITLHVAGFKDEITLSWNHGIGVGFDITTKPDEIPSANSPIPAHLSRFVCHQSLAILLDHTTKNSLGHRPLLEHLQSSHLSGESTYQRDPALAATGIGASGSGQEEAWPTRLPSIIQFIVMAITHERIVEELRTALRQFSQTATKNGTPNFRIKQARTKQPYLFAFTVLVGNSFVLEATIRGVLFHVITRLPPAQPSPITFTTFDQPIPPTKLDQQNPLAETIQISNVSHFIEVLKRTLTWQ